MIRKREQPNAAFKDTRMGETHEVISTKGFSYDHFSATFDDLPDGAYWAIAQEMGFDLEEIAKVYAIEKENENGR